MSSRIQFWKSAFWGFGTKILLPLWGILQVVSLLRSEFFPEYHQQYPIIAIIPQWPWWGWVITWSAILIAIFLEGSYRLYCEVLHESEKLRHILEELQRPALKLDFKADDMRYFTAEGAEQGIRKKIALVSVHNATASTIEDVEVSCEDVLPTEFTQDNNLPLRAIGSRSSLSLHPGQREFLRAIAHVLDDTARPGLFEIFLRSPARPRDGLHSDGLRGRVFLIKVRGRGRNTPEARMLLRFGLDDNGFFVRREE